MRPVYFWLEVFLPKYTLAKNKTHLIGIDSSGRLPSFLFFVSFLIFCIFSSPNLLFRLVSFLQFLFSLLLSLLLSLHSNKLGRRLCPAPFMSLLDKSNLDRKVQQVTLQQMILSSFRILWLYWPVIWFWVNIRRTTLIAGRGKFKFHHRSTCVQLQVLHVSRGLVDNWNCAFEKRHHHSLPCDVQRRKGGKIFKKTEVVARRACPVLSRGAIHNILFFFSTSLARRSRCRSNQLDVKQHKKTVASCIS